MADRRLLDYSMSRLRYKNPEVRVKSIEELRALNDPAGWEAIEQVFINDTEPEVHKAAQDALLVYYSTWLRVADPNVRLKAIGALRRVGDSRALDVLEQVYNSDSHPEVRNAARAVGLELFTKSQGQDQRK